MSYYCAVVQGFVKVKVVTGNEAKDICDIEKIMRNVGYGVMPNSAHDGYAQIDLWFPRQDYDEYKHKDALDSIAPLIEEGELEFQGEDKTNWKFVFKDGKWTEKQGSILYEGDAHPINLGSLIGILGNGHFTILDADTTDVLYVTEITNDEIHLKVGEDINDVYGCEVYHIDNVGGGIRAFIKLPDDM